MAGELFCTSGFQSGRLVEQVGLMWLYLTPHRNVNLPSTGECSAAGQRRLARWPPAFWNLLQPTLLPATRDNEATPNPAVRPLLRSLPAAASVRRLTVPPTVPSPPYPKLRLPTSMQRPLPSTSLLGLRSLQVQRVLCQDTQAAGCTLRHAQEAPPDPRPGAAALCGAEHMTRHSARFILLVPCPPNFLFSLIFLCDCLSTTDVLELISSVRKHNEPILGSSVCPSEPRAKPFVRLLS